MMDNTRKDADKTGKGRRQFLKKGLIAVSGLTFGFSVIKKVWAQDRMPVRREDLKVRPQVSTRVRSPGRLTLAPAKRTEAVRRIAPTLKDLLTNAGLSINAEEMNAIQQAFADRGIIRIPGGNSRVASTLAIGGSITWD